MSKIIHRHVRTIHFNASAFPNCQSIPDFMLHYSYMFPFHIIIVSNSWTEVAASVSENVCGCFEPQRRPLCCRKRLFCNVADLFVHVDVQVYLFSLTRCSLFTGTTCLFRLDFACACLCECVWKNIYLILIWI